MPKILIVDDETIHIDLLLEHLRGDYQLSIAKSGEEALKRIHFGEPPDLILLDVVMPGIDGYEVCRRLKQEPTTRSIPVLFLTIQGGEDDEMLGFDAGAEDYIHKPFSPSIVRARVRNQLALASQRILLEQEVTARTRDLERANKEAVDARREAEQASLAKSRFLSNMSHELRTPLNHICGFSQLLAEDDQLGESVNRDAQCIYESGEVLLEMIENVMHLVQFENDGSKPTLKPVDLSQVVRGALSHSEQLAMTSGIILPKNADVKCDTTLVLGDEVELKIILQQLLTNAVKYSRPGGSVQIRCTSGDSGRKRIEIVDDSKKLAAETWEKVFEPFERLGAAGGSVFGSGLGLTIARLLARRMNGVIGVCSEPERGNCFWLELDKAE